MDSDERETWRENRILDLESTISDAREVLRDKGKYFANTRSALKAMRLELENLQEKEYT